MDGILKKAALLAATIAVAGAAVWLGRKACDQAMERRFIAQAAQCIDIQDFRDANLSLRRAFAINPVNPRSHSLMADLLEDTGSPAAVNWRISAAQLATNDVGYRFAWAQTALKLKNLPSAIQAVRGIDEQFRSSAKFHKLQGALEWNLRDLPDADQDFSVALQMEPTNQAVALDLAAVELASTNQVLSDKARTALEAFSPGSPLHLTAFRYLITDAVAHKLFERAILYSQLVIEDPESAYPDKLALLDILHDSNNARFASWLATLQTQAAGASGDAATLGHWMQTRQTPDMALRWLRSLPSATQTNYPVPIIVSDCQIALHDWTGLQAGVEKQNWGQLDYYRLLLAALAARNLAEDLASEAAWQQAFQLSFQHLDRLAKLNEITASWGWTAERCKVLQKISMEFPEQAWANDQLAALFYADGKTQALAGLLDQMSTADPSNARLKNDLATVLLLQKTDPARARRLALESYNSSTNNPFCACTYAYSLLLESKPKEAVKILSSLDAGYLKNPSIAGFYGVVEAEAGNRDAARDPLKTAQTGPILPEEMELVREVAARQ